MITSALLYLIYGILLLISSPLRLLPDVTLPALLTDTIATANTYISIGYQYLPHMLDTLLITWGLFISIELAIFLYKGFMWILKKIPGIS